MENIKKRYYRIIELAQYTGIAKSTLWKYAKEGKITPLKMGGKCTVFDIEEVEEKLISKSA